MGKTLRNICLLESLAASRVFCEGHNHMDISNSTRPQAFIRVAEDSNKPSLSTYFVGDEVYRRDGTNRMMIIGMNLRGIGKAESGKG